MVRSCFFLCLCLLLGAPTLILSGSPKASETEDFFRSLDKDKDGDLDVEELRRVIRETGVEQFDESDEIESGILSALELDKDQDKAVLHGDLVSQWLTMANLISPEKLGEWMIHAAGLRSEIAAKFVNASWTGFDMPKLLSPKADVWLAELRVHLTRAERRKLIGAIKLKMLNVGAIPYTPELKLVVHPHTLRCGYVALSWSGRRSFPSVEKYRLFRRIARDDDLPENPWIFVHEGSSTTFTDRTRDPASQFDYKIEAWNIVGHSEPFEIHDVIPSRQGCSSSWFGTIASALWDLCQSLGQVGQLIALGILLYSLFSSRHSNPKLALTRQRTPSHVPLQQAQAIAGPAAGGLADEKKEGNIPLAPHPEAPTEAKVRPISPSILNENAQSSFSAKKCAHPGCKRELASITRHQCGKCLHFFCVEHTRYSAHKAAVFGKVLSPCGIESKCKCKKCFETPPKSTSNVSNSSSDSIKMKGVQKPEADNNDFYMVEDGS